MSLICPGHIESVFCVGVGLIFVNKIHERLQRRIAVGLAAEMACLLEEYDIPRLVLYAMQKGRFGKLCPAVSGVFVVYVISGGLGYVCEMSLDKMEMYQWLSNHGYKCAKSYMDKNAFYSDVEAGKINYPVFVKPAKGSASIAISKVYDKVATFAEKEGLHAHAKSATIRFED